MKTTWLFIIVCVIHIAKACDGDADDESQSAEFRTNQRIDPYDPYEFTNPFMAPYYYGRQSSRAPASKNYEARRPANKPQFFKPFKNVYASKNEADEEDAESRFLFGRLGLGPAVLNKLLFNNRFGNNNAATGGTALQSLSGLANQLPIMINPNVPTLRAKFQSCTSFNQENGICTPGAACSLFGGRPSGSCGFQSVCCVNAVTRCGSTITLNNTYWQSPVTSSPSCSLTLRLDQGLFEQPRAISQVRLDFVAFSIGQPNSEGVCATDAFRVTGASNQVPTICGDNSGQHMYLNVPSTSSAGSGSAYQNEINLSFTFGAAASATGRAWNIKISMIAAGASYLAPPGCLQYFTSNTGTVSSFNWRDVTGTGTRQLASQNYNICFRSEMIGSQNAQLQHQATSLCLTPCTTTFGQLAFSLSVPVTAAVIAADGTVTAPSVQVTGASQILPGNCNNDFLVIAGGYNSVTSLINNNVLDRFCGERFTTAIGSTVSSTVCTTASPFSMLYRTNGDESITPNVDAPGFGNRGFCLTYTQA